MKALSCLLMLASAPLRPAIRLALKRTCAEARDDDAERQTKLQRIHEAVLRVEQDEGGAWVHTLKFIDPALVERPRVHWVSIS